MGIYKFYSEYVIKLPKHVRPKAISGLKNRIFDALLIDTNGILHPVAQKVFQYADFKNLPPKNLTYEEYLKEYKDTLFETLDAIVKRANYPNIVVIAVDGVAPAAKITQQRSRRYGAEGSVANGLFDSAMITPGTDFMKSVDFMLQEYSDTLREQNIRVIYSGHMEPGEGEHKMFWIAKSILKSGNSAIVDGLDADLFMISLTADFFVTLLRGDQYFDVNEFKKYLTQTLRAKQRSIKEERIYDDFIIMLYLVGNDFLPKLEMITDVSEMVNIMTQIHLELKGSLSKSDGDIDSKNLFTFFQKLNSFEEEYLKRKTNEVLEYFYPHKVLHSEEVLENINSPNYMRLVSSKLYKNQDPMRIAYDYIDGIFWVFNYYTKKEKWSKRWIYPHDNPPLVKYLLNAMMNYTISREIFNGDDFFTTSQQLVSVIPPSVAEKFLPYEISKFILQGGELEDLAPEKTILVLSGIKKEKDTFLGKRLLPKLDVKRVTDTVRF